MLRGICFCICMSVMLSLFAQNEESNFIAPDRTVHKRSEIIKRAIKKFLDFSDFDTAYISPNRYNYALMLDHFTNYEYYSVGSGTPEPQRLRFSPKPHNKIGVYFVSIRPRACFFPLFSFLPLWLHYNLNPLCVQY